MEGNICERNVCSKGKSAACICLLKKRVTWEQSYENRYTEQKHKFPQKDSQKMRVLTHGGCKSCLIHCATAMAIVSSDSRSIWTRGRFTRRLTEDVLKLVRNIPGNILSCKTVLVRSLRLVLAFPNQINVPSVILRV